MFHIFIPPSARGGAGTDASGLSRVIDPVDGLSMYYNGWEPGQIAVPQTDHFWQEARRLGGDPIAENPNGPLVRHWAMDSVSGIPADPARNILDGHHSVFKNNFANTAIGATPEQPLINSKCPWGSSPDPTRFCAPMLEQDEAWVIANYDAERSARRLTWSGAVPGTPDPENFLYSPTYDPDPDGRGLPGGAIVHYFNDIENRGSYVHPGPDWQRTGGLGVTSSDTMCYQYEHMCGDMFWTPNTSSNIYKLGRLNRDRNGTPFNDQRHLDIRCIEFGPSGYTVQPDFPESDPQTSTGYNGRRTPNYVDFRYTVTPDRAFHWIRYTYYWSGTGECWWHIYDVTTQELLDYFEEDLSNYGPNATNLYDQGVNVNNIFEWQVHVQSTGKEADPLEPPAPREWFRNFILATERIEPVT